ncbi:hypothetical protein EDB83DRAFT_1540866 [Lactarius deliciosus]|nr:hypothetical protein EDB83DRAFT_1540866 [Lactarius deliciosus]
MSRVYESSSSPSNSRRDFSRLFCRFGSAHPYSHLGTLGCDSNSKLVSPRSQRPVKEGQLDTISSTSSLVVHIPTLPSETAVGKSEKTAGKHGVAVTQQVVAAPTPPHCGHASPASRRRQLAQAQREPTVVGLSSRYYALAISPLLLRCF